MISRDLLLLLLEDYEKHAFVEAALGGRLGLEASGGRCGFTFVNRNLESSAKGGILLKWHGKARFLAMRTESRCTILIL